MIWVTGTLFLACVVAATAIGARRGSAALGFLAGVLFGPLGLVVVLVMDPSPTERVPSSQLPRQPW